MEMKDPKALLAQAEKAAANARGGFSFFGGREEKLNAAAELYLSAANAFKFHNQGIEAGQAFEKAAALQHELKEPDDAANTLVEAFKIYKRYDPMNAARCLSSAIKHYTSKGSFRRAATHQYTLGELYEQDIGDKKKAVEAFDLSGDWFLGDNAEALANKSYLKVADLAAEEGMFQKAIERYEQVARASLNSNLMKWSLKDYFLKAGLCHLAQHDMVATQRALDSYVEMDNTFPATKEFQLLSDLITAVQQSDMEMYEGKLFEYDQLSKLDKWKTSILLKIKKTAFADEEDLA
ncbi:vesicular-fusion protein sec17 [Kalaharituber pfeilii]|nr:vesicular-fusion protein sec17 [Kalaharituber pfeilii]